MSLKKRNFRESQFEKISFRMVFLVHMFAISAGFTR